MNAFPLFAARGVPPVVLLLDAFPGASAAYSVRKLRAAYAGSAMKVVRSSDNATLDIGFVGQNLDTATLLAFAGAGNAFVIKWYDQSGNGNDLTNNSSPTGGLTIVSNGVLVVNTGTTIAAMSVFDARKWFNFTTPISAAGDWSSFCIGNRASIAQRFSTFFNTDESISGAGTFNYEGNGIVGISDGVLNVTVAYATIGLMMAESYKVSNQLSLTVKGVQIIAPTAGATGSGPFNQYGYGRQPFWVQRLAEHVFYPSNQTANGPSIRANMVAYYGSGI